MQFHFSIRNTIQTSWQFFTKHASIYIVIALVMAILNLDGGRHGMNVLLAIASSILSLVVTYVAISVTLAVVDGKKEKVQNVQSIIKHLPTASQWLKLFAISVLISLPIILALGIVVLFGIVGLSLLLLSPSVTIAIGIAYALIIVVPVIYVTTRLMFANISFVDRQRGIHDAIRHSWTITKGTKFWTMFLTIVVLAVLLVVVAICTFGLGLIVAYPIALLVVVQLYRALEGASTVGVVASEAVTDAVEIVETAVVEEK